MIIQARMLITTVILIVIVVIIMVARILKMTIVRFVVIIVIILAIPWMDGTMFRCMSGWLMEVLFKLFPGNCSLVCHRSSRRRIRVHLWQMEWPCTS